MSGERVVVGLSGGVDSAVSALLLQRAGYEVEGLFMANWHEEGEAEDDAEYCTAAQDFQDARAVCEVLEIPLHRADFSAEYRERVFAHFLAEIEAGRTPNPFVRWPLCATWALSCSVKYASQTRPAMTASCLSCLLTPLRQRAAAAFGTP